MVEDKEQRIETLQDRVDELEATVSKMLPSRRDALKLGAAGAVGAVGMAGSASAQNSNQVGTIGTDSDRVDVNAEDIDAVSVNTAGLTVGDGSPISQIDKGVETVPLPSASANDGWDDFEFTVTEVSYNDSFNTPPTVLVSTNVVQNGLIIRAINVGTSDFDIVVRNFSTSDLSSNSADVQFVAIK